MASRNKELMDGEWLERKLVYLGNVCRNTVLDCLPNVIKEALRDIYPNVLIFPTPQKPTVGKKLIPKDKKEMEDICKFAEIDEELVEEKKNYKNYIEDDNGGRGREQIHAVPISWVSQVLQK